MPLDSTTARLAGRIGAHTQHARHDPRLTTAAARRAFMARFDRDVDPDGLLPETERQRRAESLRKAYFARLQFLSAQARRSGSRKGSDARLTPMHDSVEEAPTPAPLHSDGTRPGRLA